MKLSGLLNVDTKKEQQAATAQKLADSPYTPQQLQQAWREFAEQRKKFQAEYQLLSQAYEVVDSKIIIPLHNPVQEMMLTNLRTDLTNYLRDKLKNQSINIVGELKESEEKKVYYTPREKFDYLVSKNPMLRELKERLGLDTDY